MKQLLAIVAATVLAVITPLTSTVSAAGNSAPILWVHGSQASSTCPIVDSKKQSTPFKNVLTKRAYTGPLVPIDYYCGDKTGVSIRGSGGPSTEQYPQNGYTQETPIERLGLDLAWFIYNTYTINGQSVNIASASMGGLITMYAVTHTGTDVFPPYLLVDNVLTFSTPFGGVDKPTVGTEAQYVKMICGVKTQCNQMISGSAFLQELTSQPIPAEIDVTTIGGGQRDILSFTSSSAISADHKVNFYNIYPIAYDHAGYLNDQNLTYNMSAEITEGQGTPVRYTNGKPHSLEWAYRAMTSTTW